MGKLSTKITLFILLGIIISACNAVKRVPDGKYLLKKNEITVDGKKDNDGTLEELLYQKPNTALLGFKLRLNLYNLAKPNPDSAYKAKFIHNPKKLARQIRLLSAKQVKRKGESFLYSGIHNFLKKTGEAPVVVDTKRTDKSIIRLKSYLFNNGYFDAAATYKIDTLKRKRAKITYNIIKGPVSTIDTISTDISSPQLDSLYNDKKELSLLKTGEQFKTENFEAERTRLTTKFRNNGVYYFQQSNILYVIDTVGTNNKANIEMVINDQTIRVADSTVTRPFKIYKISEVNIISDNSTDNTNKPLTDSVTYKNFNIFSHKKLKYKPKALTDAVFIAPGSLYSDTRTSLTSRYLSNLHVFNYPSIQYKPDPKDSLGNSLIANIILTPRDKYSFGASLDFTHSNIQDFGIEATTSIGIRNVFNGAETLEVAARGNIGASRSLKTPSNTFFNISEYGIDTKLNFPRILLPFDTEKIIPKRMIPSTVMSLGFAKQKNIGLDKENFTGSFAYNWTPKRGSNAKFELFNIQYVNNINIGNYFNVYESSYDQLNQLAQTYNTNPAYVNEDGNLIIDNGTNGFLEDVLENGLGPAQNTADYKTISSIRERKNRLTENNLILASSYTFSKTTKNPNNITDNDYYTFRTKLESAGNLLSLFATATKGIDNEISGKKVFGIQYSQYFKTELEYIKHWDLKSERVVAVRGFVGLAVPYGNSSSVPFSRSYFAGGSNDIRAWQPYSLGPGSSGSTYDFNEANFKITMNAEIRFKILNSFKGALFVDAGNIWNIFDDATIPGGNFDGLKSLADIAVGSGFGLRYDLSIFAVRLDLGFKTYNPADDTGKKWFRDYNFANAVLNIGINYPF
ncbi:MAG: BamA/TamA family outer membrane protein [Flavobacterium sp.]|nr:BamA/TamA family outer membrane protein [Flavobacterium sp.]